MNMLIIHELPFHVTHDVILTLRKLETSDCVFLTEMRRREIARSEFIQKYKWSINKMLKQFWFLA